MLYFPVFTKYFDVTVITLPIPLADNVLYKKAIFIFLFVVFSPIILSLIVSMVKPNGLLSTFLISSIIGILKSFSVSFTFSNSFFVIFIFKFSFV